MKNMYFPYNKLLHFFFFALLMCSGLTVKSQSADITTGCAPLTVNFTAPNGPISWYWDFKDGASSNLENPSNIFTNPGSFEVELRTAPGGPIVGSVTITVYPKPQVEIAALPSIGCAPLSVQFSDNSVVDPGIQVLGRLWVFGNGGNGSGANPLYIYNSAGEFTVSLELTTNYPSCNITDVFPALVTAVAQPQTNFTTQPAPPQACTPPLVVSVNNTSTGDAPLTYNWDFSNGNTYTIPNPPAQTYTQNGFYPIKLTVTNSAGCSSSKTVVANIGNPTPQFSVPDTVCIHSPTTFFNQSPPGAYLWNFGPNADSLTSNIAHPVVKFLSPGLQQVSLTVTAASGCMGTTTQNIYVEQADASFATIPEITCEVPAVFNFDPLSPALVEWNWFFPNNTGSNAENSSFTWNLPENSGFTSLGPYQRKIYLIGTTAAGCKDTTIEFITAWPANARFVPNIQHGCGPLEVTFKDFSFSHEDIVKWTWIFGDGSPAVVQNTGIDVSHTFLQPGEYPVQLIIETVSGCIDTSYQVSIEVGTPLPGDFLADKLELCPGETVQFTNLANDPRIDGWHFYSDENRLWHCFQNQNPSWTYQTHAGPMDVSLEIEYNGCFNTITKTDYILLKGPIARIHYKTTCDNTHLFEFTDESSDATQLNWTLGDGSFETAAQFAHEYQTGTYQVILEAQNAATGCPASYDTATVYATDLHGGITLADLICEGDTYYLNGTTSTGVNARCYKGYTWYFSNDRPIRTDLSNISYAFFENGVQTIWLEVEDINGCRDTVDKTIKVYRSEPKFELTDSLICFPATVHFFDQSVSDTTILEWRWNFGDGSPEVTGLFPSHTFTGPPPSGADYFVVTLTTVNALGCEKSVKRNIFFYEPVSTLLLSPTPNICEGQTILFNGVDFTIGGSNLNFNWSFGDGNTATGQSVSHTFLSNGKYDIVMTFTEIASGCTDTSMTEVYVQSYPEASFASNVDSLSIICYPQNILLVNTSTSAHPLSTVWYLGNGQVTAGDFAATVFPKGTYTVNMITYTPFGCPDTASQTFKVVGPEGDFIQDKSFICLGDVINFTLIDTVDISSFSWSFGDGTTSDNISPVNHQYNFYPPSGSTVVKLILRGEDDACSFTVSSPINFSKVNAEFSVQQNPLCLGQAHQFVNTSTDDDTWLWSFGDGLMETTENPDHEYETEGTYPVTLIVTDQPLGCKDTLTQEVSVAGLPNFEAKGGLVCAGDTATIGLIEPVPGATYTWTPSNTVLNPKNAATVQVVPGSTTIYTVSVVVDSSGCMDSDTALVFVPEGYPGAQNLDTLVEQGQPVNLPITIDPTYNFAWSPTNPGNPPILTPTDSTLYYTVTVTDPNGCEESVFQYTVRIFPQNVRVPNAFTPQGDATNETFHLIPDGEAGYINVNFFRIYNRWGQKIFESSGTDATVFWDGTVQGSPAPIDVYIWTASITYQTGRTEQLRGEVTLLR